MTARPLLHGTAPFLLVIALTACTSSPTLSPAPAQSSTPTDILTPACSATSTPTPTPTPIPPITVCSPFMRHSLEELPGFISWEFQMPTPGKDDGHHGVDFGHWSYGDEESMLGDPLQAVLPGKVAAAIADRPPYGNLVMLEVPYENLPPILLERVPIPAGQSLYIVYAHLEYAPPQAIGEAVECGRELNRVGLTGFSGAPHLHFETRWGPPGVTFLSMAYYTGDATPLEMQNYETWRMGDSFHVFDPMLLLTPPAP